VTSLPVRKARRQGALVADLVDQQAVHGAAPAAAARLEPVPPETMRIDI
jgi:hypothetical protein